MSKEEKKQQKAQKKLQKAEEKQQKREARSVYREQKRKQGPGDQVGKTGQYRTFISGHCR